MPLSSQLILQPGISQPPTTSNEDFTHLTHLQLWTKKAIPQRTSHGQSSIRPIPHSEPLPQPPTDQILPSTASSRKGQDTARGARYTAPTTKDELGEYLQKEDSHQV